MSENEEHGFGLVMPFVSVKSAGGELDDLAFTVGWDCGVLYGELEACQQLGAIPRARYVKPEVLAQLDLIAMEHGYTLTVGESEPEAGWRHVAFTLADPHGGT